MDPNRPADPLDIDEEREVSEEERRQILGQIERAIRDEGRPLDQELADVRPRKRGALFPIVVNVAAALLVVVGGFVLWEYFRVRGEGITVRSARILSAEGSLLETLRRESQGQIREKDAQIAEIQKRLEVMDQQTRELQASLQSDLRSREDELRRRIEAEIVAERERLEAAGSSESAIARELRELQTRRERALATELDQYRDELQLALQGKERELAESRQALQAALSAATSERVRLTRELTQREAELRAQFDRERETLRREATEAEERLAALQQAQREERLLEDQVEAYYRDALDRLAAGDAAAAGATLAGLSSLLDSPAASRVPAFVERRALDRALVGALEQLAGLRAAGGSRGAEAEPGVGGAELAAVEARLGVAEAQLGVAEAQLSARDRLIGDLRREVDTLGKTIEGLRTAARQRSGADSASARQRIAELELQAARLNADLEVLSQEKAELERWRDAASARLDSGVQEGREAALTEVLRYLNYLSRGTGGQALESQVMAQARSDPLYRAVIREIQVLRAGAAGSGELASPYLLLGTVASASGSQVVVDPLGDVRAAPGAIVQIRRSDALEQETLIARGTVEQIRGGKVYARVDALLVAGRLPAARDLVYVEPP